MSHLSSYMCSFCLFILFIITVSAAPVCNGKSCNRQMTVTSFPGHWPSSYCRIKNVIFNTGDRTLQIDGDLQELEQCHKVKDVWKFGTSEATQKSMNNIVCDQVFTRGHFFTTYYYHGSNYFHLNYDTMIPLYLALHQESLKSSGDPKDVALLPGIEAVRGEGIDWNTDAFGDQNSYWMQMLLMISKPHRLLPLDQRLTAINKTICFQEAYFGTPKVDFSSREVLHSYADFVKKALGVKPVESKKAGKTKIGLIHREGRRKILNEEELIKSMPSPVVIETVDFSQMSVKEQIEKVQEFDVLIGMNGAGLVNALYLPEGSVAVQLVPYKAQLNVEEFANLLKARGPYLEWHNNHPELDHHITEDVFRNGADTIVDVKEFTDIVYKAIEQLHKNL